MKFLVPILVFLILIGCVSKPRLYQSYEITRVEAKENACPKYILDAGASQADCDCVETELFEFGKDGGTLAMSELLTYEAYEGAANDRLLAIDMVRSGAFEICGLFDKDHIVAKTLSVPLAQGIR